MVGVCVPGQPVADISLENISYPTAHKLSLASTSAGSEKDINSIFLIRDDLLLAQLSQKIKSTHAQTIGKTTAKQDLFASSKLKAKISVFRSNNSASIFHLGAESAVFGLSSETKI